jgi:hypothetical protein
MAERQRRPVHPQSETDRLIEQANRNRATFLRTELQTCFTFIGLVETERNLGEPDHAARSLEHAERAYETLVHFMSDPKYVTHD